MFRIPNMMADYSGGNTSGASEGESAWDATKIRVNKKRSGFRWDARRKGRNGHASASSHTGQGRTE